MQNFGTKADNSPPPGGQLSAAEFNNLAGENENAVLRSGQSLSGASETQLAISLFLHGAKSQSFQDSGAANAYVVTPVSGASGVLLPADYSAMNGLTLVFKASTANTTASTLNIGQTTGTLLGAKPIVDQASAALTSGAITTSYIQLRYDSSIGAGSWVLLPWSNNSIKSIKRQTFSASGTYTPSAGMLYCDVEAIAGGGGGGGALGGSGTSSAGGGGGAGGYSRKMFTAAQIGASQSIAIGVAGTAGPNGNNAGGNGGNTTFGAFLTCTGGLGGSGSPAITTATIPAAGGAGSISTGGDITVRGGNGFASIILGGANGGLSGSGGSSLFGAGGYPAGPNGVGNAALGNGGGGSGGASNTATSFAGGQGFAGFVTIIEYCTQ